MVTAQRRSLAERNTSVEFEALGKKKTDHFGAQRRRGVACSMEKVDMGASLNAGVIVAFRTFPRGSVGVASCLEMRKGF
jgi:hypothetical protein